MKQIETRLTNNEAFVNSRCTDVYHYVNQSEIPTHLHHLFYATFYSPIRMNFFSTVSF